jgi:N,N'-diacetyllegionaminate synthase
MSTNITIDGHSIGDSSRPYIIAELGINHGGDLQQAKKMLVSAAEAGADAAKLQVFRTELFLARDSAFFDVLDSAVLSETAIRELDALGKDLGITLFASVFDEPSADLMQSLGTPAFKMASGDLTHLPLLRYVAAFGKPMILSTGGSTMDEIATALNAIRGVNPSTPIAILHCVSNYPTQPEDANLACMAEMEERFGVVVGFSDHTLETITPLVAVSRGAKIIEKHFTLDRDAEGPDHALSCDPAMLKQFVEASKLAYASIGRRKKAPVEPADFIPLIRRSVTAFVDIPAGTTITREMLAVKRPGTGIQPVDLERVVGTRAIKDIGLDETLTWNVIDR